MTATRRAKNLVFPEAVLEQHLVVLGKTGAGKSSALRHIVEHLLSQNKRVCIVDPKGDWHGLKVAADGKGPGFPVILFGEFKETAGNSIAADVPLNEYSGKHIAELVTSGNRPCVIGLRGWTQGEMHRFWIDFASTFFNTNEGEMYLVVDEVHNFAPKGKVLSPEVGKCLHWTNRLLSEARGLGAVMLIASQRPQKVHNDTLTACETLVAMRVIHKADRGAVEDWIAGNGDKDVSKEVLNSLAGMKRGEAYVWAPEVEFGPTRLTFPMFTTYDSFAPPQLQKKIIGKDWGTVDLDEVRDKLSAVIEKAKAEDPRELQKQVADLKGQLRKLESEKPKAATMETKIETVDKLVVKDSQITRIEKLIERFAKIDEQTRDLATLINGELATVAGMLFDARKINEPTPKPAQPRPALRQTPIASPSATMPRLTSSERDRTPTDGDLKISRTQQRILDALAWYESIGNPRPTNIQVGAIALLDATGGHFSNTVGPLSSAGLVVRDAGAMSLTDHGRKFANVPDKVGTLADYHDVLRRRVKQARSASNRTVDMLNAIIEAGGFISNEDLGTAVGIDHTGGHFSNTIGPLSTLGLIRRSAGIVEPTEVLFPPGLS